MNDARHAFDARFIPEPNTGCWLWLGMYQVGKEYGLFCFKGKTTKAHRAAWSIYRGEIPSGLHVLHKCDTPACVNPEHLFVGTHQENMRDMVAKGRATGPTGERAHLAKLSTDDVIAIRKLRATTTLTLSEIGRRYGVYKTTINRIVRRETWTHV